MKSKVNLLIVDDHIYFMETLIDLFEENGAHCIGVTNGAAALRQAEKKTFDAVLLDINMPHLNGVETLKKIKRNCEETVVIMMTAHKIDYLVREALAEGARAILKKPFDIDDILAVLKSEH